MIIMLDIDGVLHPDNASDNQLFMCLPFLYQILISEPKARVVVTSAWRLKHSVDDLRDLLFASTSGLNDRFLGVTPSLIEYKNEYRGRELEVLMWLSQHDHPPWLALDDIAGHYTYGSSNLYLTNYQTGLTEKDTWEVLEKIHTLADPKASLRYIP